MTSLAGMQPTFSLLHPALEVASGLNEAVLLKFALILANADALQQGDHLPHQNPWKKKKGKLDRF